MILNSGKRKVIVHLGQRFHDIPIQCYFNIAIASQEPLSSDSKRVSRVSENPQTARNTIEISRNCDQ